MGRPFLVIGVLVALLEAGRSGRGQVVDAAMVDGAASLMALLYGQVAMGLWDFDDPGGNMLDTGAPFYEVYECADGGFLAVGAIELEFMPSCSRAWASRRTTSPGRGWTSPTGRRARS